jgi:fructokinase
VIVVAGEALVDLVPDGDGSLRAHPGGGPFNTARTIGRLEQPVAYLGRLSSDRFGQRLAGLLAEDGVDLATVVRTHEPTTLALAEVDPAGVASYRFYAAGTAAPGLTPEAALAALPAEVAILHVGTLGLALEPMAMALEAVVESLAGRALVAVDPNCRPDAAPDENAYRQRLAAVIGHSDVVKVSEEDLRWLHPGQPERETARELLASGPAVVLLTRGDAGAAALLSAEEIEVPAPPARIVDTIGAGDAFGGAFVAWWHSKGLGRSDLGDTDAVREATRFACLVAARTCERAGASPPRLRELRSAS